jgi:REP element-mobilizing transposase RayT
MSRLSLYFHIVWATKHRQPLLTPVKEAAVYKSILKICQEMGYTVLALNGMPDHIHILLQSGAKIDFTLLMQKVKGVTSALLNDLTEHEESFRWQQGYYAATVTPSHLARVQAYVENQKQHHLTGTVHAAWEETGEPYQASGSSGD